ncbi:MAG: twin-arginine translocase subunit TatC [Candidatus Poseidoniaceae archaeon]
MKTQSGLQLENDQKLTVQEHLNLLTQQATLAFVLIFTLTGVLMTQVDEILEWLLIRMNPCETKDCLTLYEPASWSVVRWLTAIFIAMMCILPLIVRSFYKFAQPGLTKNEKLMFRKWTVFSLLSVYSLLCILFFYAIPMLYSLGDSLHTELGLTSQYDAVQMFVFILSIFWTSLIGFILVFATISAGSTGLITDSTQDWWRVRIHGIGGLVLLLSLPGRWNGTNIALITTMIIVLEYVIKINVRKTHAIHLPQPMFDHEGRRRNVTFVDCSCQGVAYPIDTSPKNTGLLRYEALCENINERDDLIDYVSRQGITDVIIGGCTTKPLPNSFKNSIQSVQCSLRGLDLLGLQGSLSNSNLQLKEEVNLAMSNQIDPWSRTQRIENTGNVLTKSPFDTLQFSNSIAWPEQSTGSLRINVQSWTEQEKDFFR